MSEQSPYSPSVPPRSLRTYKKNPYKDPRSKWNLVRWINIFISGLLMLYAVSGTDTASMLLRLIIWLAHAVFYIKFLYNVEDMDRTFTISGYYKDAAQKKHIKVKFRMEPEEMGELCPVEEIHVIIPGVMTIVRYRGSQYGVILRGVPKKRDRDAQAELELRVKKFLDGIWENLYFKAIRYTVKGRKQELRKGLSEAAAAEGKPNKARDLHLQDLISYVDTDTRPQNLERFVYFQDLGRCRNLNQAIIQYKSIMPGVETLFKTTMHSYYVVTNPAEILGIYDEFYNGEEALI